MQLLLINQNATIERLVRLSSGKLGYEFTSAKDISEVENGSYAFIVMDSDLYNDEEFGLLKQKFANAKYILIITKGATKPDGFDIYVEKPFLPTELVDILSSLASTITSTSAEEEAVFGDLGDGAPNGDIQEISQKSEDDIFAIDGTGDESISDVDAFDSEPAASDEEGLDEIGDIDLALDEGSSDVIADNSNTQHLELPIDEEMALDDENLEIDLGEHLEAAKSEEEGIDFDMPTTEIGGNSEEIDLEDKAIDSDFGDLDDIGDLEKIAAEDDVAEQTQESTQELGDSFEDMGLGDLEDKMQENSGELEMEPANAQPSDENGIEEGGAGIFDDDEVNKLKDLLDETEEEKPESDDFDIDNIKIHNDEFGSLTEESLAEALGVNLEPNTDAEEEHTELRMDDEESLPDAPTQAPSIQTQNVPLSAPVNAIELTGNQNITLSLDAIKELLNIADVTINITLSKKQ